MNELLRKIPGLADSGRKECSTPIDVFDGDLLRTALHRRMAIGGMDAVALDEKTMDPVMSPFDFFAKMWLGAEPMIAMQNEQLGQQIEFTGQDLADIIAFVHNADVQKTFSQADIPGDIKEHMESDKASSGSQMMMEGHGGMVSGQSKGQ